MSSNPEKHVSHTKKTIKLVYTLFSLSDFFFFFSKLFFDIVIWTFLKCLNLKIEKSFSKMLLLKKMKIFVYNMHTIIGRINLYYKLSISIWIQINCMKH